MRRFFLFLAMCLIFFSQNNAMAHHCNSGVYLTYRDYYKEDLFFHNCKSHLAVKETNVYYYSNGTRRNYVSHTIYNTDGSILVSDCSDVKHYIFNNKHYLSFYKNKKYQIIDEQGTALTIKNYKSMKEIFPNRFLVKLDKKYGIIDCNENIIVPIKYQKFEQVGQNLFLVKLNGYWGLINGSNEVLVRQDSEKINKLHNAFVIKKYDKYGLADINGRMILPTNYDKIEGLGEYIIVKKDKKYGVYDSNGNKISDVIYKKIRLERNSLQGKVSNNWDEIVLNN